MKSKIPCLPGFVPVNAVTHAAEVIGIGVDLRKPLVPSSMIFLKVGSFPSLTHLNNS
jgi:hypothetical protein